MTPQELRALQAPLKARFREEPESALKLLAPIEPTVVFVYVKNILGLIEYARGNWHLSR